MPATLSKKIFTSFSQMLTGKGINTLLTILAGYFSALILGPAVYGVWQTAKVFIGYGAFINLGIPYIVQRDYPALRKEEKHQEAGQILHQGISFGFFSFPLFAAGILAFVMFTDGDLDFKKSLLTVALWFVVTIPSGIGTVINKAVNDYKTIGIAEAIYGFGNIAAVPFIYLYGLDALLIGYLVTAIVQSVYYFKNRPVNYSWYWDWKLLRKMIFSAFPIFLVYVASSVFASLDRLIIAGMLNFAEVGLYSLSSFIASPVSLFVSTFSIVLFTQLNERYGRSKELHVIEKHVFIPQKFFSNLLPPLIGIGIIIIPTFTGIFLPKYTGGITAAQINIFAIYFYMLAGFSANALFVLDKQIFSALSFLIAGVIKSAGSVIAIRSGYGIEGVAVFSLLGFFTYNTLMLFFICKSLNLKLQDFFSRFINGIVCPVITLAACFSYFYWIVPLLGSVGLNNIWLQMLIGVFMVVISCAWFIKSSVRTVLMFNK